MRENHPLVLVSSHYISMPPRYEADSCVVDILFDPLSDITSGVCTGSMAATGGAASSMRASGSHTSILIPLCFRDYKILHHSAKYSYGIGAVSLRSSAFPPRQAMLHVPSAEARQEQALQYLQCLCVKA